MIGHFTQGKTFHQSCLTVGLRSLLKSLFGIMPRPLHKGYIMAKKNNPVIDHAILFMLFVFIFNTIVLLYAIARGDWTWALIFLAISSILAVVMFCHAHQ